MPEIDPQAASRIYVAFDYPSIHTPEAESLLSSLQDTGAGAKVGLEITTTDGWITPMVTAQGLGFNVFADAKLHDIGNTVSSAAKPILGEGPEFINVHGTCSEAALKALVQTRDELEAARRDIPYHTKILGVTVLTDVENDEAWLDYGKSRIDQVRRMANKVLQCGLDGVVCSPAELDMLAERREFDSLLRMVPAIRPAWSVPDDQKNFTTPTEAIHRGATHIVVGRPITKQFAAVGDSPLDAFEAVAQEVKEAM